MIALALTLLIGALPELASNESKAPLKVVVVPNGYDLRYKKFVSAHGFPILATEKVSDFALLEAGFLINKMLDPRPEIRKAMVKNRCRLVIMAHNEWTTDVAEHSDLEPKDYWNRRARGLGPTPQRPAVSCGEENLLCFPGDPYAAENILIHEFAHAMHLMGLNTADQSFDKRLRECYEVAMGEGLWKGKYAATNKEEYWAECVQSWFDTNRPPDHDHNHVRTRADLKKYDPRVAELVKEVFGDEEWRYQRPQERKAADRAHLAGYEPKTAPRFEWPPGLKDALKKK